jgi:hypothetical protein
MNKARKGLEFREIHSKSHTLSNELIFTSSSQCIHALDEILYANLIYTNYKMDYPIDLNCPISIYQVDLPTIQIFLRLGIMRIIFEKPLLVNCQINVFYSYKVPTSLIIAFYYNSYNNFTRFAYRLSSQ